MAKDKKPGKKPTIVSMTDVWDEIIRDNIDAKSGWVNYQNLEKNDLKKLDGFLAQHANLATDFSDLAKTAIYINFYNAGMIRNILRYAESKQIKVASEAFLKIKINTIKVPGGNIWNGEYRFNLSGHTVTLDQIEHDLIRGKAKGDLAKLKVSKLDPRIHTAVNCAARSCPRIREKAYRAENVAKMLEENIGEWLTKPEQFSKVSDTKLRANQIVFWYYDDFDTAGKELKLGGAGDYLSQFIDLKRQDGSWIKTFLKNNFNDRSSFSLRLSSAFDFFYDWQINDQRNG